LLKKKKTKKTKFYETRFKLTIFHEAFFFFFLSLVSLAISYLSIHLYVNERSWQEEGIDSPSLVGDGAGAEDWP
jgi:hypothetical protein